MTCSIYATLLSVPDRSQTTVVVHEVTTKRPVLVQVSEGDGIAFFSSLQLVSDTENMEVKGIELNSHSSTVLKDSHAQLILVIFQLLEMKCFSNKMPELTPAFLLARKRVSSVLSINTCKLCFQFKHVLFFVSTPDFLASQTFMHNYVKSFYWFQICYYRLCCSCTF